MALEPEKIVANTKKYFDTATKLGFMNDELMTLLGEAFIKAPASSMQSYHNAFEGGLIHHLLNVTKYAVLINNALPEDERANQTSLIKVCLLHQIGKANLYLPCTSEWHRKNQGKLYVFNESIVSMRVGERSIYYAQLCGIKLTEEEHVAILNHDKVEDKISEYHNSLIGDLLKMAATLAIRNERKDNGV